MKRVTLLSALALLIVASFSSCQKEDVAGPEIITCFFDPSVPIRVINAKGEDLLDPAKLPNGTVEIKWETPGTNTAFNRMTTIPVFENGVANGQFYMTAPLTNSDKGLTIYFSVKQGDTDTLFIKTAANSSKPYGLADLTFNGKKIEPKMLFNNRQLGIEIVKDGNNN